jgi:hypothetical protein
LTCHGNCGRAYMKRAGWRATPGSIRCSVKESGQRTIFSRRHRRSTVSPQATTRIGLDPFARIYPRL